MPLHYEDTPIPQPNMDDTGLSAAIVAAVRQLFQGPNRDQLSVNNVRKQVEEEHGLESGFFAAPEWKSRSKTLIKETVVCLRLVYLTPYENAEILGVM